MWRNEGKERERERENIQDFVPYRGSCPKRTVLTDAKTRGEWRKEVKEVSSQMVRIKMPRIVESLGKKKKNCLYRC